MVRYQTYIKADTRDQAIQALRDRIHNAIDLKVTDGPHNAVARGQYRIVFSSYGEEMSEWGITSTDHLLLCWFRDGLMSDGPRLMEFSDAQDRTI